MIPKSARSQFTWSAIVLIAALVYGLNSGGDQFAVVLVAVFGIMLLWIGIALVPMRVPQKETLHASVSSWSVWPIVGAAAVTCFALGFAVNGWYTVLGAVVATVAALGALGQSWREDIGWNPHFDDRLGERVVRPILLPVVSLVGILIVAISVSRVLLHEEESTAVVLAMVLAAGLLVVFSLLAATKHLKPSILVGLSVFAAVATISVGIAAAGAGQHHEEKEGLPFPKSFAFYAQDFKFVKEPNQDPAQELTNISGLPANRRVTFQFFNYDDAETFHDVALYQPNSDGTFSPVWAGTPIAGGKKISNTFLAPRVGTYELRCDFHPAMIADVTFEKAPPVSEEAE